MAEILLIKLGGVVVLSYKLKDINYSDEDLSKLQELLVGVGFDYQFVDARDAETLKEVLGNIVHAAFNTVYKDEDWEEVRKAIEKRSKEYSQMLMLPGPVKMTTKAPTHTIPMAIGDTSAGIHPVYDRHYSRNVRSDRFDKEKLGDAYEKFKALAKELDLPIIVRTQEPKPKADITAIGEWPTPPELQVVGPFVGRLTCTEPNIQEIPKPEGHKPKSDLKTVMAEHFGETGECNLREAFVGLPPTGKTKEMTRHEKATAGFGHIYGDHGTKTGRISSAQSNESNFSRPAPEYSKADVDAIVNFFDRPSPGSIGGATGMDMFCKCDGGSADCKGFLHSANPFEIERDDEHDRFKDDDEARIAHEKECGCGWPSFDFQNAIMAWMTDLRYSQDGKVWSKEQGELCNLVDCRGEEFFGNLKSGKIIAACTKAIDLTKDEAQLKHLAGVMSNLKTASKLLSEGKLTVRDFGDPEEWGDCNKCERPVFIEEAALKDDLLPGEKLDMEMPPGQLLYHPSCLKTEK